MVCMVCVVRVVCMGYLLVTLPERTSDLVRSLLSVALSQVALAGAR